ncbi:winged helix-turn-helix transcriptional regulator [Bosea sp. F3-2]|uniref:MarR family winged helix-turn-helix transcriptional regulator n=1 Tax=Bosea sp. F3-2 TaxID=2599640 RepID=UPI0011EE5583|nr:MarR family winged helix-turn-helix transcriptional regulator [Bosea sp. F3-2]QEL22644.1 winged helix-turn-helix transcriptional regulator [Bosea sp. F3-2]
MPPRDAFLTFRLDQLSQTAMAKASQVYKAQLGLNIRELRVIRAIGDAPGLSSRALSEATFIEQTLISKHLRKLVDEGYVHRQLESADARKVALDLTPKGEAVRQEADRLGEEMERDFLSALTPDELDIFNRCLVKLRGWGAS